MLLLPPPTTTDDLRTTEHIHAHTHGVNTPIQTCVYRYTYLSHAHAPEISLGTDHCPFPSQYVHVIHRRRLRVLCMHYEDPSIRPLSDNVSRCLRRGFLSARENVNESLHAKSHRVRCTRRFPKPIRYIILYVCLRYTGPCDTCSSLLIRTSRTADCCHRPIYYYY